MAKRVGIIGAGASGLVAMRCCLEEGLEPVCFERTDDIGGIWKYKEQVQDNQGSVTYTTVINTSKEMMCYSDFPIPSSFPNYMHNSKVYEYFHLYAEHFDLKKYVRFQTEILQARRSPDFEETGRWILDVKDLTNGNTREETVDALLLCSGHHCDKNVPRFEGDNVFKGKIVHTHDYRNHKGFENKRVVVIGIGNSGGDVTVDLSRIAKQVYLSTRRGSWIFNRVGDDGKPGDMLFNTRLIASLPPALVAWYFEKRINERFNHATYGIKPQHKFYSQHPTVNDELPNRIISGTVIVKPDVRRFTETGVEFVDGTVEENIDVIILATGYVFGFPYLEKGLIEVQKNKANLYKYMFPPQLSPPTLAVIGCIQPVGAINPISELECRWATRIFKGVQSLPSQAEMTKDIKKKAELMAQRYVASQRHTIQVDYVPFMDELAEQIGCKPNIKQILKEDPRLALELFFGPCTPYQYRLCGPGKRDNARDLIMTTWERANAPYKTRTVPEESNNSNIIKIVLLVLIVWLLWWLFC